MSDLLILSLVFLPIASALLISMTESRLDRRVARISVGASTITFLAAGVLLWESLYGFEAHAVAMLPFMGSADQGLLWFDPLSTLMAFVVSGISLIVHVYSVRYMAEEAGYGRFFSLLDLMTASLLLMVLAGDLLTLIVAWHFVAVLLYLLLGQNTRSHTANRYALWTFFTYRIGDFPLVLAAVLLFQAYDTWSLPLIFEQMTANPGAHTVMGMALPEVVASLIALSAFARSAQFFLHTWLPYTMDGPTPVSALMHAGIVNAGGFLINRFAPVFMQTSDVLHWVFIVGLLTALAGSVLMLSQTDIKKALGYSTMGQMGFMIMECGVGAFSLAVYHLIAHGVFKGTLFLSAGGVIHEARKDDGVPKDELYTFMVERKPAKVKQPWLVMAGMTLLFPIIILIGSHWLVAQDYFQQQGAIILLFFGWATGAQLIFATYHMGTGNLWRLFMLVLVSFTIVVMGYAVISHAFDLFLYPDEALRRALHTAAGIDLFWFDVLVVILSLFIVLGWVAVYYHQHQRPGEGWHPGRLWVWFYARVSREFYINDVYRHGADKILRASERVNTWLRWI